MIAAFRRGKRTDVQRQSTAQHSPASQWWQDEGEQLSKENWLSVLEIPSDASQALAEWAQRGMQLQLTLDEDSIWVSSAEQSLQIQPVLRCGNILNH